MANKIILFLALSFLLLAGPSQIMAKQGPSDLLVNIHKQILDDPANIDLHYKYIQAAIEEGEFELAIGALEGMLVISGNQPQVLLELGVLYQRLNSPKTAINYLLAALKSDGVDREIASLAEEYLKKARQQDTKHFFKGIIGVGLRSQSNPTGSPETSEILSGGVTIPLPERQKRETDSNALLFSRIDHSYNLIPRKASIASELTLFGTAYDKNDQLNFGSLELLSGPKFESKRNATGYYSIHPHFLLRGSFLDGAFYEKTTGVGLDFQLFPGSETWLTPYLKLQYQFRDIEFMDFDNLGGAPLQSGEEHRIDLRYRAELTSNHFIEIGLFGRQTDTERDYYNVKQYNFSFNYNIKLDNFFFQEQPTKMTVTPYVVRGYLEYDEPDPSIDQNTTRDDSEWLIGLKYLLPFTSTQTLLLDLVHSETNSNIINYDRENNSAMVIYLKEF